MIYILILYTLSTINQSAILYTILSCQYKKGTEDMIDRKVAMEAMTEGDFADVS